MLIIASHTMEQPGADCVADRDMTRFPFLFKVGTKCLSASLSFIVGKPENMGPTAGTRHSENSFSMEILFNFW